MKKKTTKKVKQESENPPVINEIPKIDTKTDITEKEQLELRQEELNELKAEMVKNDINSIGKLDNLLGEVLKRLKEIELQV